MVLFQCMVMVTFNCSPIIRYLGCFQFFTNVNIFFLCISDLSVITEGWGSVLGFAV